MAISDAGAARFYAGYFEGSPFVGKYSVGEDMLVSRAVEKAVVVSAAKL